MNGLFRRGNLPAWRGWLLILFLTGSWEAVRRLANVSPLVMPPLGAITNALVRGLFAGDLFPQLLRSIGVIIIGSGSAVVLAVLIVPLAAVNRWIGELLDVAGALFHPLPGIALLPVVVLWFGVGTPAVTAVIVHSVFWPVVTNLRAGYRALPETWRLLAANFRLSGFQYLLQIALPGTLPYLLAGLRIAWARSWRALISAEMVFGALAGGGGIGWFLSTRRAFMDAEGLFSGILLVMIVGSLVESLLFTVLEDRTIRRWGMSA
jgi:NitT/TauT family transport system permease protein